MTLEHVGHQVNQIRDVRAGAIAVDVSDKSWIRLRSFLKHEGDEEYQIGDVDIVIVIHVTERPCPELLFILRRRRVAGNIEGADPPPVLCVEVQ